MTPINVELELAIKNTNTLMAEIVAVNDAYKVAINEREAALASGTRGEARLSLTMATIVAREAYIDANDAYIAARVHECNVRMGIKLANLLPTKGIPK